MVQPQPVSPESVEKKFSFCKRARRFPVTDARPYRWPTTAATAVEYIDDWKVRAGSALAHHKLSKATMHIIASHTSRKDGTCPLTDRALSSRSGRSIPSTKRDIGRLKKLGFLIAEVDLGKGYRKRSRLLILATPDRLDEDQRIPRNEDQRIPSVLPTEKGSTYPPYVDPIDIGERRDV